MTNAAFKLEDAGFSREQVEAITEYVDQGVATKADIERLEGKIQTEVERLRGQMQANIERLEGKINHIYWMFGVLIAGVASLVIKAFSG